MKRLFALAVALSFVPASYAEDYGWASTATADGSWHTVASWTNSVGEAATVAPSEATDTVAFPFVDYKRRIVDLVKSDGTAATIASLSGAQTWRMRFNTAGDTWGGKVSDFSVGDINGFAGEWASSGSKKTLVLTAASGVQALPIARVSQQFSLNVVNAATTADIIQLRGTAGSVRKTGAGDLRIRDVAEPGNLVLEIEQGNVQVDGRPKTPLASDSAVLRKAAVHLDASARSTWETGSYVDGDGRTRVTKWLDVHGNGAYAEIWDNSGDSTASHLKTIPPPFISSTQSSTGLPFMDFGARSSANVGTYGPQALMRLGTRIANAQEVFLISALNDGTAVLGDDSDLVFSGSSDYVFTYGTTILQNGGFARFNGNRNWQELMKVGDYHRMTRTFDNYTAATTNALLANVKFGDGNAHAIHYLGSDRLYATAGSGTGGVRIGELLIFTEVLTDEERTAVTDYLMRKWFASADHHDFHLANAANGTSITVPEGREARIDTLRVKGTAFTKKGAGTLRVGRIYPEDLAITIEGGDVKLDTTVATGAVAAPVGTPQFWFDAESANAFEKDGDNVTAWCDRRDATKKTSRYYPEKLTAYPYADTESMPGHTVLTFPNNSSFQLPAGGQRETFVVFSYPTDISNYTVLGNGYTTDRGGSPAPVFAKWSVLPDAMGGGIYSVDGKPVRPSESVGTTFVLGQWHVAHLSTTTAFGLAILASNGPRTVAGNVRVAEIITYTTALTPDERRKNIDYLMNRWTGKRHPEFAVPSKNPTLAFSGDAELGSDTEATYAAVTGSGSLVKTGSGSTTVTAELADSFTALAVEGGTLTVGKPGYCDRSAFHFDAMSAESLTTYVSDNGSGGLQTNVSSWADVRANGITAQKRGFNNYMNFTNPVLTHVEMRPGVWRPALDFLDKFARSDNNKAGTYLPGAGMDVSTEYKNIVEAHVVFSDKPSTSMPVFTAKNEIQFNRGGSGHLFASAVDSTGTKSATQVQEGYIALDNSPATPSTSLPSGFHLVSIVPTSAVSVNTIGAERSINGGGSLQSEIIGFTTAQSQAERQYLQAHLMHKWFGEAKPVWTNQTPIASVSVAAGATLNISGDIALQVSRLSGSGTINAASLANVSDVVLECNDGAPVTKTVEGDIGFADEVTLTLDGDLRNLGGGEYTLIEASGKVDNFRPSAWTVVSNIKPSHGVSVKQSGNAIVLNVQAPGVILIVW